MKEIILSVMLLVAVFVQAAEESFIKGKLGCQLGNQMFQIATTTALALDHGAIPVFPDLISRQKDGIPENYKRLFYGLNTSHLDTKVSCEYQEPFFHYQPIPYLPNMSISGYFQSEKYFKHWKQTILDMFAMPDEIREYLESKYQHILNHPNTVSIHLRSYHDEDSKQKSFFQMGRKYVEKAIKYFPEDALFVVFSNRMEWCEKVLKKINRKLIFIKKESRFHDLYLMSLCKHNIISNSSFSWWAAYLNPNKDKMVLAPAKWFGPKLGFDDRDLLPEEWIRINY